MYQYVIISVRSSSSSSGETQDTETSSTMDDESAPEVKPEKEKVEEKAMPERKGRGRPLGSGKKNVSPDQPKKRLGRPPKARPPPPPPPVPNDEKKTEDGDATDVKKEPERTAVSCQPSLCDRENVKQA